METQEESEIKSLYGVNLVPKKFESVPEMRKYTKNYAGVREMYGYAPSWAQYDFISDAHPEKLLIGIDDISVEVIDIETTTEHGKIDPINTPEEILLITSENIKTGRIITFGSREVDSTVENYVLCKDETELLRKFISFIQENDPDVLNGWNSNGFDIPYIVNRANKILGEGSANELSPFGLIDIREVDVKGKTVQKITIVGRECLDELELYKKFTFIKRDNDKLDTIAKVELGEGKLVNPYSTFREFYEKDFSLFVKYNQIDVKRVVQIDNRLGLINLALVLAYLTKCNYSDVFSPVKYWGTFILSSLKQDGIFVNIAKQENQEDEPLDGAYVMEPIIGFHSWLVSIDGSALYPNIIKGLNISPETLIEKLENCGIQEFLDGKFNFKGSEFTVAANGVKFKNNATGVLPRLVSNVLNGRTIAKTAMLVAKQEYIDTHDEQYKKIVDLQNTLQLAYKVAANSLFGICGNKGFIFYDHRLAEAITHTGQFILKYITQYLNDKFNIFFKTKDKKYIIYGDTDSCSGDSLVYVNGKQIPIAELYDMFPNFIHEDDISRNYVKPAYGVTTKSFNTDTQYIEDKQINYVMKHRVKKEMFKITTEDGHSVIVTSDHSVIVKRGGVYLSVKPIEIDTETDIIININSNNTYGYVTGKCKVESLGIQEVDVYDIEVDDNHNFFANDILIHNSLIMTFSDIVKKHYSDKNDLEITAILDKLMEGHLVKFVNEATTNISDTLNYYDRVLKFKREFIASGGFWLAKKKYAVKVYNNEGVQYNDGDFKIMGIEVVRSSTPEIARNALKECVILTINNDIEGIRKVIDRTHQQFLTAPIEEIAFASSANNLKEYSDENMIYSKGTPIQVRGTLMYNFMLEKRNLTDKYQPIEEGSRILYVYLKEPNHLKEDVVSFIDTIPKEFDLDRYVDRETQFEKVFMSPINRIMKAVGWELEKKMTLDDFLD